MAKKKTDTAPTLAHSLEKRAPLLRAAGWIVLAGLWLLVAASLVSYHPADAPGHMLAPQNAQPHNWVGLVGATIAHKAYLMVGPGVWVAMAGVAAFLVATAMRKAISQPVIRAIGLVIMSFAASAIVGLTLPGLLPQSSLVGVTPGGLLDRPEGVGGLVAIYINSELVLRFGGLGTLIINTVAFWVGALLAIDEAVLLLPRLVGRVCLSFAKVGRAVPRPVLVGRVGVPGWAALKDRFARRRDDDQPKEERQPQRPRRKPKDDPIVEVEEPVDVDARAEAPAEPPVAEVDDDDDEQAAEAEPDAAGDAPGAYLAARKEFTPEELRAKIKQLPINFAPPVSKKSAQKPREIDLSGYQFPGYDLLVEPESNFTAEMEGLVRDQAEQLEMALQQYRIEGEVVGIDSGPVITLFEVRLAPGTKVSALSAVASDLARSLKAQNIRIVPNTVGRDTVGIEVPNIKKEKVRLKELMTVNAEQYSSMKLPMFLGKDASGNPLIADLASMPHMLIAGTTGSGKSVCMNSIIMSFLYTKRPDELKLVLVDPKMVEMSMFKDIPHLMCPVVTEMGKAASILEWAVTKMDERYELLAEAAVRDISGYNSLTLEDLRERFQPSNEEEEARIPKKLPYMVFIIDELADLMMTNKEVEGFIVRIAQKARAVGIHLILATQRPQANVVTGLIKSNMPCRVSFKVASGMDSRIVLDQKGAELLLGQGDMLYLSPRTSKLTRAQGTLVDDLEIRKAVKFLKEIAQQNFEPQLVQIKSAELSEDGAEERDPLFNDAVRVVLETKRGSVSLLQRRLTIGYARSSRMIEQMAQAGILGDYKGSQAREVTMTLEEWDAIQAQAQADAADGMVGLDSGGEDDDGSVPDEMDDEYRQ